MRVLSLVFCLLLIQGVALSQEPEQTPPETPSVEKEAQKAIPEKALPEKPKEGEKKAEVSSEAPPKEAEKKPESAATGIPLEGEKKIEVISPEAAPEEKRAKKTEKWTTLEGGFAYRNVTLHQGSYTFVTQFEGEMINNSGTDYSIVKFVFSTYDGRGRLITEESFHMIDFNNGQTKPFKGTAVDGFREIASFKIRLKSGVAAAR